MKERRCCTACTRSSAIDARNAGQKGQPKRHHRAARLHPASIVALGTRTDKSVCYTSRAWFGRMHIVSLRAARPASRSCRGAGTRVPTSPMVMKHRDRAIVAQERRRYPQVQPRLAAQPLQMAGKHRRHYYDSRQTSPALAMPEVIGNPLSSPRPTSHTLHSAMTARKRRAHGETSVICFPPAMLA